MIATSFGKMASFMRSASIRNTVDFESYLAAPIIFGSCNLHIIQSPVSN